MQTKPPVQPAPIGMMAIVFGAAGFALLLSAALAFGACAGGFLFSGLSAAFVTLAAAGGCAVIASGTAIIFRRSQRPFGWRKLLLVVSLVAPGVVSGMSYLDTRQHMQMFVAPSPVPSGLRVHHGRSILFGSYVHFTGPPATIASVLQSKGLLEVQAESLESSDDTGFGSRERSKVSWGWWLPTSMPDVRFYFLHHKSEDVQGWSEGWWVSGATNEVYAFISG